MPAPFSLITSLDDSALSIWLPFDYDWNVSYWALTSILHGNKERLVISNKQGQKPEGKKKPFTTTSCVLD